MVTCFSGEKQVSVVSKDVYRPSIFVFPHPYPLALAVIKFPAVFIFITRAQRTFKRKERICEKARIGAGRLRKVIARGGSTVFICTVCQ